MFIHTRVVCVNMPFVFYFKDLIKNILTLVYKIEAKFLHSSHKTNHARKIS